MWLISIGSTKFDYMDGIDIHPSGLAYDYRKLKCFFFFGRGGRGDMLSLSLWITSFTCSLWRLSMLLFGSVSGRILICRCLTTSLWSLMRKFAPSETRPQATWLLFALRWAFFFFKNMMVSLFLLCTSNSKLEVLGLCSLSRCDFFFSMALPERYDVPLHIAPCDVPYLCYDTPLNPVPILLHFISSTIITRSNGMSHEVSKSPCGLQYSETFIDILEDALGDTNM